MEEKMKRSFLYSILFFTLTNLCSYDKINVTSYVSDESLLNAKYISVYKDNLYVVLGKKMVVYSSTLSYISSMDLNSENSNAVCIADDKIYVLDKQKSMVYVDDIGGKFLFSFASRGDSDGQLSSPSDIACGNDKIFIADTDNSRINVYDKNGIFLYHFSTTIDGKNFLKPVKIVFDPYNNLYCLESKYNSVLKYSREGKLISNFSVDDTSIGINSCGFIYGGGRDGKIREYDLEFNRKGIFSNKGKNKYEFMSFTDIRAYKNGIFVLDSKNKKILYLDIENKNSKEISLEILNDNKPYLLPNDIVNLNSMSFLNYKDGIIYFEPEKGVYFKNDKENKVISQYGEGEERVKKVVSMALLGNRIYVLDSDLCKVKVFENFKYSFSFGDKMGMFGGEKEARFRSPVAMSVDLNENVYILDSKLNMIQVFNKDGIFLYSMDLNNLDKNIKFLDIFQGSDSSIFLLSPSKIYVLNKDGAGKYSFDLAGVSSALSFAYDGVKYLFVLDSSRVHIFDKKGNYIKSFFAKGDGIRELSSPEIIRYYNGKIFISDSKLSRISSFDFRYNVSVDKLGLNYEDGKVNVSWDTDDKSLVKEFDVMKATDINGNYLSVLKTNELNYTDKDLNPNSTYYYKLKTISLTGDEFYSKPQSIFIRAKEEVKETLEVSSQTSKNRPPLEIVPVDLKYIFSANYKYYMDNPIGKITVRNNTGETFENIKVSFFLKEYMDFPYDIIVDKLEPNSSKEVGINATLNNKILTINENTPLQSQIKIKYYSGNKENECELTIPVKILSKDSIVWDDTRRIANFITSKDPLISQIAKTLSLKKDEFKYNLDPNIIFYSLIHNYISSLGVKYVEDPVVSYKVARSSDIIIDTVQYPRNLIKVKAGDCDDLTALYASLFEAVGIRTFIMDYPDHITLMFELKNNTPESGIPDEMLINYDNSYYVPVEVTMLSKPVYEAISYAASNYKLNREKIKFYDTREALKVYEPPTLDYKDENIPDLKDDYITNVTKDLEYIKNKSFEYYEDYYKKIISADKDDIKAKISLAILYASYDKIDLAQDILKNISDDNNSSVLNNIGNIYFLKSDYAKAIEYYDKAYKLDPYDANILVNMAKANVKLGHIEDAKLFFNKAVSIDSELSKYKEDIFKN